MKGAWESTMNILLCLIICAVSVCADDTEERRSKLPYIADAAGNNIPRPYNVPASVGSPVNLLTPDRYEFYTFDESGELVKRLMTLEEIQAIVAAGDDADGLVTFANENQPTIAFNFSQPPYTKVNSVVTNVQNVLKAQMEAHKNNPQMQPTLDTPDVSDSWSLILPSIFGNTGVDIVPDKTSGSFITPETETIEVDNLNGDYLYTFSKESNSQSPLPSSAKPIDFNIKPSSTIDTKNTKPTPVSAIQSTTRPNTVRIEPKPLTMKPSTVGFKVTTEKVKVPITTIKPVILSSTTMKTHVSSMSSLHQYTQKPDVKRTTILQVDKNNMNNQNNMHKNVDNNNENIKQTTKKLIQTTTEKLENTYVPVSTVSYISQKNISKPTSRPIEPTTSTTIVSDTNSILSENVEENNVTKILPQNPLLNSSVSNKEEEYYKTNITTITTQSVSPATISSSTEVVSYERDHQESSINDGQTPNDDNLMEAEPPIISLFDVAQSFSQIASDLGSNFAPIPTASNVLDNTKQNNIDLESKENIEIDIPQETEKVNIENQGNSSSSDNYVKVITLDVNNSNNGTKIEESIENIDNSSNMYEKITSVPETFTQTEITTASDLIETTTLDLILSDSMDDLLSQVVYQTNNIVSDPKVIDKTNDSNMPEKDIPTATDVSEEQITTTEAPLETSTTTVIEKIGNNNEQIISLKSEENLTTPAIIISTTERIYKNDDSPEFVPIFIPIHKNITKSELPNISEDEKNNGTIKLTVEMNQFDTFNKKNEIDSHNYTFSKYNIETTTQIETTTVAIIKNDISIVKENKLNSGDINKVNNINNDKVSGIAPKIDEFKKKIQKINIDDKELANERNSSWKLIPTVPPPKAHSEVNQKYKPEGFYTPESNYNKHITLDFSKENQGLEVTTKDLSEDISQFVELCNELSFQYWNDVTENKDKKRSFVLSPYAITSMLAMMFMGARGATSGEMNEILKLDDMVTFNPHFILKNISDSIDISPASGVAVSAFIRELYSDRSKGKILTFYKERAQQFYNGHVEEINFKLISDVIRRRTNLLVKRYTFGKITEYMKTNAIVMQPPLAAFSMNIFETDCSGSSVDGRDGEMYFVVSPNVRQRRLVPVPAVVYRTNFLAGYDPVLDATAAALGNTNSVISTLFLMPGQQGNIVHGEDLEALEKRLLASNPAPAWNRLLRTLLPRVGLELQIPRFSHKSIFNISSSLRKMGLKDLFNQEHADLGGLNGPSKNLYLSDMVQLTSFVTCGESVVSEQHHIEEYPESLDVEKVQRRRNARWLNWDEPRDYQRAFHDPHDVGEAMHLPLHLRPRQARLPARNTQPARLKFDRPFLFFVRHNPSGMILYVGRYNPRLLP